MAKKKKKSVQKKVAQKKKIIKKSASKKKTVVKKAVKRSAQIKSTPKKVTVKVQSKKIDYTRAVTPLGERLVVRLIQAEQVTAGGLIIPGTVSMSTGYLKGIVLAVGSGLKNKKGHLKPLDVQVGDTILFQSYNSTKIEFNLEELHIVNESDVLGIV